MAFILEFAEHMIRNSMEDPKERDEKLREHLYDLKDKCEKLKATWAQPVKPYGFWTTEAHHQKYDTFLPFRCASLQYFLHVADALLINLFRSPKTDKHQFHTRKTVFTFLAWEHK